MWKVSPQPHLQRPPCHLVTPSLRMPVACRPLWGTFEDECRSDVLIGCSCTLVGWNWAHGIPCTNKQLRKRSAPGRPWILKGGASQTRWKLKKSTFNETFSTNHISKVWNL